MTEGQDIVSGIIAVLRGKSLDISCIDLKGPFVMLFQDFSGSRRKRGNIGTFYCGMAVDKINTPIRASVSCRFYVAFLIFPYTKSGKIQI